MLTRAQRFDDVVLDAMSRLERRSGASPSHDPARRRGGATQRPGPWEHRQVPLGRMFPATATAPYQVVVYRRPITTRCRDEADVIALVTSVLTEQVAGVLGVTPEQLDPRV